MVIMTLFSKAVACLAASFAFLFAEEFLHWAKKITIIKIKTHFLFIYKGIIYQSHLDFNVVGTAFGKSSIRVSDRYPAGGQTDQIRTNTIGFVAIRAL
jgi:hypothetical protein